MRRIYLYSLCFLGGVCVSLSPTRLYAVNGFSTSISLPLSSSVIQIDQDSIKELMKAAFAGDVEAQFKLALYCDEGTGVPQNQAEAAHWYRRAAEQGHLGAQFNLAVCYETGIGVSQSYNESARWYR